MTACIGIRSIRDLDLRTRTHDYVRRVSIEEKNQTSTHPSLSVENEIYPEGGEESASRSTSKKLYGWTVQASSSRAVIKKMTH